MYLVFYLVPSCLISSLVFRDTSTVKSRKTKQNFALFTGKKKNHVIEKVRGNVRRKRAMVEEDSLATVASSSENRIALWEIDTAKKLFKLKATHETRQASGQTFGSLCWDKNSIQASCMFRIVEAEGMGGRCGGCYP